MDNIALLILGVFISVPWDREHDWKYQHNTFLQPKKGQGRGCTEVRESRRHRYTYHRRIFDSGICHNFLE